MNEFSAVKENLVKFSHNPKLNGNNNLTREKKTTDMKIILNDNHEVLK